MQSLQLDEPLCVPFVWDSTSPGNRPTTPPPHLARPLKSEGDSSSSVASSGLSYAAAAKGAPGQAEPKTDDKAVKTQKADKLETLLATLDPKDPLREDLQPQLDQLRNDLRYPRQPGARLDSAVAKKRKAEAKVAKCEEALRQAEESLRLAREENTAVRGSASDTSAANSLIPAILRLSMLCGFVVLNSLRHSAMLAAWLRNLPGDNPARPEAHHGQGDWLHTLPSKWSNTLLDPVFRWGLHQRLGVPAPGAGEPCGRTPPGGKRCNHILDPLGRHAGLCNKGLSTCRHDRVRDHIALVARQAGLTAQVEQNTFVPGQTLENGQPAPGSVRPIHRADLHIIEATGSELWLDVRIHTVAPNLPVTRELLREEQTKLTQGLWSEARV